MLALKKVAVTGGFASGKSSTCQFLKELGAYVVSADEIVHNLLSTDTPIGKQVIEKLGAEIVKGGQIDRKEIADMIFKNRQKLKELESILHPAVSEEIEKEYQKVNKERDYSLFAAEIPLLFEAGFEGDFDYTLTIVSNDYIRRSRVKNKEEYARRDSRQLTDEERTKKADFIINNNGTLPELKEQVTTFVKSIQS